MTPEAQPCPPPRPLPLAAVCLPHLRGGRVLAGLSGGRDSVALLRALLAEGCELCACHVHHGLRGAAADADEQFCRELCTRLGLPLVVRWVDVPALARQRRESLETAARAARRAALAEVAREQGCASIALAHHADDQAETVLFRLARGAAGARGMRPVHRAQGVLWLRPLLECRRAELTAWLRELGQAWVEDATNAQACAARNRLRLEVLPALNRALGRDTVPILARSARVQEETQDALQEALARLPLTDPQGRLYLPALRGAGAALVRAALHRYLSLGGVPDISSKLIDDITAILPAEARAARVNLPGGGQAARRQGRLVLLSPAGEPRGVIWQHTAS